MSPACASTRSRRCGSTARRSRPERMSTITPTAHVADFAKMKRIVRFIGVRLLLALVTLWLLSMIVFAGGQLLPGDVGRAILGPLADARAVAALNHQLGVDRPLLTQYSSWIG